MSKKARREVAEKATKQEAIYRDFKPKTKNQAEFLRSIAENDITICNGPAGTGKTMLSIGMAVEYYFSHKVNKILLSKSIIGCDNNIGYLPGDIDSKTHIYMQSLYEYLEYFIPNKDRMYDLIDKNALYIDPVEVLRGRTYHESFMVLDESQNVTPRQLKMFMSRMGHNSKLVLVGDTNQSDIGLNGLSFLLRQLKDSSIKDVGIVEFDETDILRNGKIGPILKIFDKNGY